MTVDCIEAAGDSSDVFGNWDDRYENTLWNGREVTPRDYERKDLFVAKAQTLLQILHAQQVAAFRHEVELLDMNEQELFFELASSVPIDFELAPTYSSLKYDIQTCGFFKKTWDHVRKPAKKTFKVFKKVISYLWDMQLKILEKITHGTKKAAENVADFVKEHKKEVLISIAIIAAIAGGYAISVALGKAALTECAAATAVAGLASGGTKRKENDENSPPLPDWMDGILKATAPDFSLMNATPESLSIAKQEAHNAWDLFNHLKSDTENHLACLREFQPEFNPSLKAVDTIFDTVLTDAQRAEFSKVWSSSQNWNEIFSSGHDRIDQAFSALAAQNSPVPKNPSSFMEKIQLGLEIIGHGMCDPDLFDPNILINHEQAKALLDHPNQNISEFLTNVEQAIRNEKENLRIPAPQVQNNRGDHSPFKTESPLSTQAISSQSHKSRFFKTEGISIKGLLITFINGMNNSFEEALQNAEHLRTLCPGNLCIEGIYNHTNGIALDFLETFKFNYNGYSPNTQDLLMQKWSEYHVENIHNPDAKILHICHSQGAIHTKNALLKLPQEIRDRIIVVAIAPAAVIPKEMCFASLGYASEKDIVYLGEKLSSYWHSCNLGEIEREEMLVNISKIHKELVILQPHEGAKGLDHEIRSPTFIDKLKNAFENYVTNQGGSS